MADHNSSSLLFHIGRFFSAPWRANVLEAEKNNLEAFLNAFPGEYCGLTPDGYSVYSPNFCSVLGITEAQSLADIQAALSPSDSAALEGMMDRLTQTGTPFTLLAASFDNKLHFKFSGRLGENLQKTERFSLLWVEDITQEAVARDADSQQREKIQEELSQIRVALDALPRPVWLRDTDQKLIWVNKTYCDYLDKSSDDIISAQIEITSGAARRNNAEGKDAGKKLAHAALESQTPQEKKLHGIFHGKRLLLRLSEIPLNDSHMTLGLAYNVTREEELETELARYNHSTNELMEHLRSAIVVFDASQQLSFYNTAFAQLFELDATWLSKKPKLGDLMEKLREKRRLPEQADFRSFKQSWLDMFTNLIKPHDDLLHLPDSSALRMLVVPHSQGGLMLTFEDVTSRLALESSYNTLIAVQKETLDNLAEAVSVFGGDGRLKLWNPSYATMWNLNAEDLDGEPHINRLVEKKQSFFTEETWDDNKRAITAKALKNNLAPKRITCTPQNAAQTLLDVSAVPLPDGGALVTYTDVTSTVEIEDALREKAHALEAAEQLKLDFLTNMSYQLRTPLNSIMGFTDILSNEYFGGLNDKQKEYTADINNASERLLTLINNILDLSTLEAGFLTLEREDFDITDMMHHIKEMVSDWARTDNIEIILDCAADIGALTADKKRIQQAIINLVRNAITFTPEGGTITLSTVTHKNAVHFTVTDTGHGIASEDKARIFKPFERAKNGEKSSFGKSGAGVGLSLVRRIAEAHNGSVNLESEEGQGTSVTLIIPLTSVKTTFKVPSASS